MGIKDLLITPVWLGIIYFLAYTLRPVFTDNRIKAYFIPGLSVKVVGALAVGFIYQFYYGGGKPSGDTFNYFKEAQVIFNAFLENPKAGIQLLLANGEVNPEIYEYANRIYWFDAPTEYFVIKLIALFSLFTGHTYTAVATIFAAISFSGIWAMYRSFYKLFPALHKEFAIAMLFVPSVFFWGSGILKDTITLGALGWATWGIVRVFFERKGIVIGALVLFLSLYTIYSIKIYIVLCFLPAAILWVFLANVERIKSVALRILILPFVLVIGGLLGYYAMVKVGEDNNRYSLDKVSETAEITARYLTYMGETQGGSVYTLGDDYDFSPTGMLRKFPLAVNVTLFRPYLWEAHNVVMLLSALESFATLLLTLWVIYQAGVMNLFRYTLARPIIGFCLLFAIAFSFAVGISTYNFGSLVRYKIPMFPFYLAGLFILRYLAQRKVKLKKRPKAVLNP
ncbi:hypothetical protein PZB74_02540 [Porifericola rhodea]|uniref:hypothetical protein n=1 Tax=Porifericola rhodea TaxID=930972 RepID=UPI002666C7A7|nr:hypothetical protein [Porifericola rhodea]WKN32232.1 hypothetical protein PZB74_02540 [Porifericola rhodea]